MERTGRDTYLPASVGIWYVITMALGLAGIGILARTVEDPFGNLAAGRGRRFSQRWWALRTAPMLILLPVIGRSQMRGQVGLLIVFLFVLFRRRDSQRQAEFRAGLWLSGALCVKLIPAILLAFALSHHELAHASSGSALRLLVAHPRAPSLYSASRTASSYQNILQRNCCCGD